MLLMCVVVCVCVHSHSYCASLLSVSVLETGGPDEAGSSGERNLELKQQLFIACLNVEDS